LRSAQTDQTNVNLNELEQNRQLSERWEALSLPGDSHTSTAFSSYLQVFSKQRNVLNCAIPLPRAKALTDFELPDGVTLQDCMTASVTGSFPASLKGWKYEPKIRSLPQLPYMKALPPEYSSLIRTPWFQSPSQATWLGINARHLRYHYQLWQELKPKVLQGAHTTLILGLPQMGYCLTPHIQLENTFLFLASLGRGLCPAQLFPARYIYPDANLGEFADTPAPIFADILPLTGGSAYPVVDCEPDPWRTLARFGNGDRFYGYPFRQAKDSVEDFTLQDYANGVMLLPNGKKVTARASESYVYATLDPKLKDDLMMARQEFESANCLLRAAVTHDGLPFQLPVELQPLVYGIILTHWRMELDKPGDLNSYRLQTAHAAIRGFNYFQKVEPCYTNFMRLIEELAKNPDFQVYPLSTHLTNSWLGGNLRLSNQQSQSEMELGPELMRSYYQQQLDWQAGVVNLMNHVSFRSKTERTGLVSYSGREIEKMLSLDGLAFHQMNRLLRFDSHLFQRPLKRASFWPDIHPGWMELDQKCLTESLPKL
jgi:hypothetical protein